MSEGRYISLGKERLHYLQTGTGAQLLLAFHGYGNDAGIFDPFPVYLGEEYTMLSFDLPHHGLSKWNERSLFTKEALTSMVTDLKAEYKVQQVALLGYSMGGRVCLTIIECMPESVGKATLVATDGLKKDPFYHFFTHNAFGKKVFRHLLAHGDFYLMFVDWLKAVKIVSPGRHKFVTHSLPDEASRAFLLKVWPGMSDLSPDPEKLRSVIREHSVPVTIFMGINDKIIPASLAEDFKKGLESVSLHILKKGHRIFDDHNIELIAKSLL